MIHIIHLEHMLIITLREPCDTPRALIQQHMHCVNDSIHESSS